MSRNPKALAFVRDQMGNPAYRKWFCSMVVDAQGMPLVVYHGTSASEPIKKFAGNSFAGWFATNSDKANAYTSDSMGDGEDGAVYPVYLSIKKPLDLSAIDASADFNAKMLAEAMGVLAQDVQDLFDDRADGDAYWSLIDTPDFREWVQALGNDGLKITEDGALTWAALRPEQIKSALCNRGAFSQTNPNICMSRVLRERGR